MMILAMLTIFFLIAGFACPPLLLVSGFFGYLFYSRTRSGVRRIRAGEAARAAKLRQRERGQALRYFS
jgi:hypothetical protein